MAWELPLSTLNEVWDGSSPPNEVVSYMVLIRRKTSKMGTFYSMYSMSHCEHKGDLGLEYTQCFVILRSIYHNAEEFRIEIFHKFANLLGWPLLHCLSHKILFWCINTSWITARIRRRPFNETCFFSELAIMFRSLGWLLCKLGRMNRLIVWLRTHLFWGMINLSC